MRKLIVLTFCLAVFTVTNLFSQTVNDVPLKDVDVNYFQILGKITMSGKRTLKIDFGRDHGYWDKKNVEIKDENGKEVKFSTMIDALNFFNKNGYELDQATAIANPSTNILVYILKKKSPKNSVEK